jgi:hypothetical protein
MSDWAQIANKTLLYPRRSDGMGTTFTPFRLPPTFSLDPREDIEAALRLDTISSPASDNFINPGLLFGQQDFVPFRVFLQTRPVKGLSEFTHI